MAYSTRGRDPLLDAETHAVLERRSKELLGLGLIVLAGMVGLALGSYSPLDPSFLGSSLSQPQNLLGYPGAWVASSLSFVLGRGAWGLVVGLAAWGLRFVLHRGAERLLARIVFLPIWVAICAIYAANHVPGAGWGHHFGLGGMFGDAALGMLVTLLPMGAAAALKLSAVLLALVVLVFGLFCLGFTREEITDFARFLGLSLIMSYDTLMRRAGRAGRGAIASTSEHLRARRESRQLRAEKDHATAAHLEDDDVFDSIDPDFDTLQEFAPDTPIAPIAPAAPAAAGSEPKPGLLSRLSPFGSRTDDADPEAEIFDDPDDDARVQQRISGAIQARMRADRAQLAASRLRADDPAPSTVEVDADGAPVMFIRPERGDVGDMDLDYGEPAPAPSIPKFVAEKTVVRSPAQKAAQPSARARAEAQPSLLPEAADPEAYEAPPLALLRDPVSVEKTYLSDEALQENARMLETVLDDYGVKGEIVSVRPGPVVTMYELEPAPGLKASRVIGLADDIARSMSALAARVSTVPGRTVIGIELPNDQREMVLLRELLSTRDFDDSKLRLPLALGKDIGGAPVVANLAKMPHLLIAGTTGSGKSVAINTMILSLLYKLSPEECRLIMIDPKMLELSVYDGIPHLLSPVVTDPKKAVVALKWVVGEMEDRYRKMSKMGVRNIEGYNGRVREALSKGEMFTRTVQTGFDDETGDPVFETEEIQPVPLPFIVVVVDEMADLMMVAGKEIEACIQRLAQMARASGIHLIMATQRPSVDVITGTIKANFPTRISFQVTSKVDSRTILGEMGAEQLLGMGDMLYMAGGAKITRVHGPFASDEEVEEVVQHLKALGPPDYVGGVVEGPDDDNAPDIDAVLGLGGNTNSQDALYDQAVAIVIKDRKCSTSYIQRKLGIGYNKAARLVEQMEDEGLVSPANHVGKREILVPEQP